MIFETFLSFLSKVFCFTAFINDKGCFPQPLSEEEESEYIERSKNGDMQAREILIRHNLRLVAHIVKKYNTAGEADDLISVGSVGLIKGVESFEQNKGSQLSTYVARCIENEILMYIRANKKHRGVVSLSEPVGTDKEGNEITMMEILPSEGESDFERIENDIIMERVLDVIDKVLSRRERKIICMRYGLRGSRVYTQLEVAKILGISRSYVSRIEKKAIGKLTKVLT